MKKVEAGKEEECAGVVVFVEFNAFLRGIERESDRKNEKERNNEDTDKRKGAEDGGNWLEYVEKTENKRNATQEGNDRGRALLLCEILVRARFFNFQNGEKGYLISEPYC